MLQPFVAAFIVELVVLVVVVLGHLEAWPRLLLLGPNEAATADSFRHHFIGLLLLLAATINITVSENSIRRGHVSGFLCSPFFF